MGLPHQRLDWRNERSSADRGFHRLFSWRVALAVIQLLCARLGHYVLANPAGIATLPAEFAAP